MKSIIDFFKNFRSIIKILQFVSECLSSFAEIYNKYYPQDKELTKDNKVSNKETARKEDK